MASPDRPGTEQESLMGRPRTLAESLCTLWRFESPCPSCPLNFESQHSHRQSTITSRDKLYSSSLPLPTPPTIPSCFVILNLYYVQLFHSYWFRSLRPGSCHVSQIIILNFYRWKLVFLVSHKTWTDISSLLAGCLGLLWRKTGVLGPRAGGRTGRQLCLFFLLSSSASTELP